MNWIALSEKDHDNAASEKRLWDAADQLRANSGPKSQEYSAPVLGLIFLRFTKVGFATQHAKLEKVSASVRRGYPADGILTLIHIGEDVHVAKRFACRPGRNKSLIVASFLCEMKAQSNHPR